MNDDPTIKQPPLAPAPVLEVQSPTPKKAKRVKPKSRPARWNEACAAALLALEGIEAAVSAFETAVADLRGVQEEYDEWKENMPENAASSPLGEKLEAVTSIEIEELASTLEEAVNEAREKIEEAEGADLPRGWGKD